MAQTPTEYCITYTKTNQANTVTSNGNTPPLYRNGFAVSGNTNVPIGKITRIVFRHSHSSTRSATWSLYGRLHFADGSYIDSDVYGYHFGGNVGRFWNTFTTDLPDPEKFATWDYIQSRLYSSPGSGQLYWRADKSDPMVVQVYFWTTADLVDGAEPPVVDGVDVADASGLSDAFGAPVQGASRLIITGRYALDANYPYLTARHALTLTDRATGVSLYSAAQDEDAAFDVGAVDAGGQVDWVYTVTDSAGNAVSASGSFELLPYAVPAISGLEAERYTTVEDDQGHPAYIASDDGERVRFSFTAAVTAIGGLNAWTLKLRYGAEGTDEGGGTEVAVASGADGGVFEYTEDRDILTAAVSASTGWWFRLVLADAIGTSTMVAYIGESGALFNVEESGVAVGMRTNAKEGEQLFEVAEDYESRFHGGIRGVTNYATGERPTGGRWLDGKPLYRAVIELGAKASNVTEVDVSLLDIGRLVALRGMVYGAAGAGEYAIPIPSAAANAAYTVELVATDLETIAVTSGSRTWTYGYLELIYTRAADAARTIWVYSARGGAVVLAQQSEGMFVFSYDAGLKRVEVTEMAGLPVSGDGAGNVVIGG